MCYLGYIRLLVRGSGLFLSRQVIYQEVNVHIYSKPVDYASLAPCLPVCAGFTALNRLSFSVQRFWKNSLGECDKNPLEEYFYPVILIAYKEKTKHNF